MKKIYKFHAIVIAVLLSGFIANNIGEVNELVIINNIFLIMVSFTYLLAALIELFVKDNFGSLKK